jgi:3',5'-cyclic-AMP phosphodiesterase
MSLKFIVLSDLHLLPDGETNFGVDTTARLETAIATINARHSDADYVVLAGDLADRGERVAYEKLYSLLKQLSVPCHVTIGNHDHRPTYLEIFGAGEATNTGYIDKVIDQGGYRVILMDSAEEGTHSGRLADSQLIWLADRLDEAEDKPVIVVLHHHANPLRTAVDDIILENGADFAEVLMRHGDVRQVIAGHVHYTSTALWRGIPFTTLADGTYSVTIPLGPVEPERLEGPGQMAVVLADEDGTLVHFDNYFDNHQILTEPA